MEREEATVVFGMMETDGGAGKNIETETGTIEAVDPDTEAEVGEMGENIINEIEVLDTSREDDTVVVRRRGQ